MQTKTLSCIFLQAVQLCLYGLVFGVRLGRFQLKQPGVLGPNFRRWVQMCCGRVQSLEQKWVRTSAGGGRVLPLSVQLGRHRNAGELD